jgi:hypothetical protein
MRVIETSSRYVTGIGGTILESGQARVDTHPGDAALQSLALPTTAKRQSSPIHGTPSSEHSFAPAISPSTPTSRTLERNESSPDQAHKSCEAHASSGPVGGLYDGYLCLLSDMLDDLEGVRIATENRVRALTRSEADVDGELRGLGLDARSPEVARAIILSERLAALEHDATLDLKRAVRNHPLHGWIKRSKGVGEKQAARLLAVIGDPYWNDLHDRPRTVSELWAYCGYSVIGGAAQRRQKGVRANWNDKAKSRAFLLATSCIKQLTGTYRPIYDSARAKYADATHSTPCVRCGPSGSPAAAGTPLSAGHQHQRALRAVSKEILRDLWLEAREVHAPPSASAAGVGAEDSSAA